MYWIGLDWKFCIGCGPFLTFWGIAFTVRPLIVQISRFRLVALLIVLPLVRIGEASNSGPEDAIFILGIANSSGLRSKAPFVASQMAHGDMWAFSETRLCSKESNSFDAGMSAKVLQEVLRHSGVNFASAYVRPCTDMIVMHATCIAAPWPSACLIALDRLFSSCYALPFRRQTKELDHLPVPTWDSQLPPT